MANLIFLPENTEDPKVVDILLVTGDAYVDHHSFGVVLIGRTQIAAGYKVGIIAQPDWRNSESLKVMGRPKIACAISSGNLDSMLNIYTSGRRIRKASRNADMRFDNLIKSLKLTEFGRLCNPKSPPWYHPCPS